MKKIDIQAYKDMEHSDLIFMNSPSFLNWEHSLPYDLITPDWLYRAFEWDNFLKKGGK